MKSPYAERKLLLILAEDLLIYAVVDTWRIRLKK